MEENLLIPTDFSIESLNLVKAAMEQTSSERINIVFVFGYHLPDSITELLFFSPSGVIEKATSPAFTEACNVLKNKYQSRLGKIRTQMFTGTNLAAFESFTSAHQITAGFIPQSYSLKPFNRRYFDCTHYFLKSKMPVYNINWNENPGLPGKDQLAELFV